MAENNNTPVISYTLSSQTPSMSMGVQSSTVILSPVDPPLTIAGQAADARVTGQQLALRVLASDHMTQSEVDDLFADWGD